MPSIAPASYHSISPTAYLPDPTPPHPRVSLMVSVSLPLLYVDRWLSAALNVRLSDRGHTHWRDARGQVLTSCPHSISVMVMQVSVCVMREDGWFSSVTFTLPQKRRAGKGHGRVSLIWVHSNMETKPLMAWVQKQTLASVSQTLAGVHALCVSVAPSVAPKGVFTAQFLHLANSPCRETRFSFVDLTLLFPSALFQQPQNNGHVFQSSLLPLTHIQTPWLPECQFWPSQSAHNTFSVMEEKCHCDILCVWSKLKLNYLFPE